MDREAIRKQLQKTGESPFVFEELVIEGETEVFLPVRQLNEMRRKALTELSRMLSEKGKREGNQETPEQPRQSENSTKQPMEASGQEKWKPVFHVQIEDPDDLETVLEIGRASCRERVYEAV